MNRMILSIFIFLSFVLYSNNKIAFKNFEIYKLKNNLHSFKFSDLDNDKLKDIVFVDNSDASIAIYYGQTEKESEKLKKEFYKSREEQDVNKLSFNFKYKNTPYITEKTVTALAIANISSPKLKDIIYLTSTGELFIINQIKKRNFKRGQTFKIDDYLNSEYSLVAKDINNDKKDDLILLGKKYLYVFYQNSKRKLSNPVKYSYSAKNPLGIEVNDINGDGLNDIIFVTSGGLNQIRVKFQLKDNTIGSDNIIDYPNFHFLTTENILKNKKAQFISSRTGAHVIFIDEIDKVKTLNEIKPSVYSLNPEAVSSNKKIIFSDFNNDGKKDMIVSDPMTASLMFFKGNRKGFKNFIRLPALKNISQIIKYKISSKNKLLGFSQKENTLFIYNFKNKIPEFILTKDKLLGITNYKNSLYFIVKKEEKFFLQKVKISPKFKVNILFSREISSFGDEFDSFFVTDLNNDKKEDVIFTIPYEGAKIFVSSGYSLTPLDIKIQTIKSFLLSITSNQIKTIKQKGKNILVVSNQGIIRYFKYDKNKGLKIISQINGETPTSDLTLPVKSDVFKQKTIFFDKSTSKLYIGKKHKDRRVFNIKGISVITVKSVNTDNDKTKEFIILGRNSIFLYDDKNYGYKLKNIITYRLTKEKSISTMIAIGNFKGKKLVSVDGIDHSVNFFEIKNKTLKPVLKFKVFDAVSYRGRENVRVEEPKEIYIKDMNNDKKDDIILYVHDKLLIYYQK